MVPCAPLKPVLVRFLHEVQQRTRCRRGRITAELWPNPQDNVPQNTLSVVPTSEEPHEMCPMGADIKRRLPPNARFRHRLRLASTIQSNPIQFLSDSYRHRPCGTSRPPRPCSFLECWRTSEHGPIHALSSQSQLGTSPLKLFLLQLTLSEFHGGRDTA